MNNKDFLKFNLVGAAVFLFGLIGFLTVMEFLSHHFWVGLAVLVPFAVYEIAKECGRKGR